MKVSTFAKRTAIQEKLKINQNFMLKVIMIKKNIKKYNN